MANSISIILKEASVDLSKLGPALDEFAILLKEVDRSLSGRQSVDWPIERLEKSSALVEVTPTHRGDDMFDSGPSIITACIDGLESLMNEPVRPAHFSDRALNSAKKLALMAEDEAAVILVGNVENEQTRRVSVAPPLVANVDEIIGVVGHARGALEGRLETLTMHGGLGFTIYDPPQTRGIRCDCSGSMAEQLKDNWGARVLVYGNIGYNKAGDPISIRVESVECFKERDRLPQVEDIEGLLADDPIDTADLSVYLRE